MLSIGIAYILLIVLDFLDRELYPNLFFAPTLFSLAINVSLKTSFIKQVAFTILSVCIFIFSFFIVMINAYYGPKLGFVILGTTIGALLEIVTFSWLYSGISKLTIKHLWLGFIIGALSFSIPIILIGDYHFFGNAFWYSGVAYVIFNIYKTNEK